MAASTHSTQSLSSEKFVESCGAILFDLRNTANIQVCLVQHTTSEQWLLAKGRRNQGESRKDAAIREVMEETGFRCRLLALTMPTRATGPDDHADVEDKAQVCENLTEPFMCQIRTLRKQGTKIIWWYVATLEEDGDKTKLPGEAKWKPEFMTVEKALTTLHFANDRDLLRKAFSLVGQTISFGTEDQKIGEVVQVSKKAAKKAAKLAKALKRDAAEMEDKQEEPSVKTSNRKMKAQKRQHQRSTNGMTILENSSSEHILPRPIRCSKAVQSTDVHPEPTKKGVKVKGETIKQRSGPREPVRAAQQAWSTLQSEKRGPSEAYRAAQQEWLTRQSERRRHKALLKEATELVQKIQKVGGENNRTHIPVSRQSPGHNGHNTAAETQATQASTIMQLPPSSPWAGHTLLGILESP